MPTMDLLYALLSLLLLDFTSDFQFYDYYTIHVHLLLYRWYSTSLVSCSYLIIP